MNPPRAKTRPHLACVIAGGIYCSIGIAGLSADRDVESLPRPAQNEVVFSRDIKPIFERSCLQCHSGEKPKGKFRLDSRGGILKGGESQEAAVVPGKSASSPLVRFAADAVKEMEMPPLEKRDKFPGLSANEIGLLRAWIDQGAKWPEGVTLTARAVGIAEREAAPTDLRLAPSHAVFEMIRLGNQVGIAKALKDPSVVDARDESGNTPLIQAAFYLDAKHVAWFLDKGADINATNNAGATALMKAAWDLNKTRLLLKHGAKVNVASQMGNTALIIACYAHGAATVIQELIAHGADVQAANGAGGNAITAAAESGDVEVLRILLDHGGNPNSQARIIESNSEVSALMAAAQLGHVEFVKMLLARGADVNLMTEHGNALHAAAFTDRQSIARLLLDRGIKVNASGRRLLSFRKDTGLTPLMYAALNERNDPTLAQWLIQAGADVNARASSGETALSIARQRGNTKIVSALLAAGAKDEELKVAPKRSPLWSSEQVERFDAKVTRKAAEGGVAVLVKSGAKMNEATANRCASCHQQNLPAVAWSMASQKGFEYPEQIAKEEFKATIRSAQRFKERSIEQPPPVPNIGSWLLIGLGAAHYPADSLTDQYAYALARHQYGDGRWITKASRAPTDYSDVTSTAVAIRALKHYAPPTMKKRIDRNIAKAVTWLRGYPADSTEERAMQILGLHWAGRPNSEIKDLAKSLIAAQRKDGGWAQIATLESDAYATGLALYALNQAGAVGSSTGAYQSGVKYLLSTQLEDGSWLVQTRASPVQVAIDGVFPHENDQWISSMATGWASLSLMYATEAGAKQPAATKLSAAR